MSFESAESYCKGKQMQLVKIKNKETNQLVYNLAKRIKFGNYWINGNDKESEGVFVDSDNNRLNYTNWALTEPNNYGNSEHCVHVLIGKYGLWNDIPCDKQLNAICEPMDTTSYHFSKEKMSFESAESYCKAKEMQLVKVKNKETNKLVYNLAKQNKFGNYWINGNDKESEGVFVDSDKKRLTYTNWAINEPNNYENSEHCVNAYIDKNGLWNDFFCDRQLNVICEPMDTSSYHFPTQKMSFELAESYCKTKEMQLVKIKNKETNQLVYNLAKQHNFGNYWINGNDKESEGVFVDSDKKRLTYTNWAPTEPNNYENSEHCVHAHINKNGLWNDIPCGNQLNVICEPIEITGYHIGTYQMSFESGETYCKSKQMQLVKIKDKETNELVYNWAKRHKLTDYWINGNDKITEGVFVDSDMKRLTYFNWTTGEPNNDKKIEHCINVYLNDGRWNDIPCHSSRYVICEPMAITGYHFATHKMPLESGETYCKSKQMQLVKIKDKETNELVYNWAKRHKLTDYWINGNDKITEGVFVDSDMTRLTYFNWALDEPNNYKKKEHCLHVYINNGRWNDFPCHLPKYVICEPMATSSYHFPMQKMSFELAESYCKTKEMQLVKIKNETTNQLVYNFAKRHNFGNYWINGNDKDSEGVFVDSNQKRLTYTNWAPTEPNNYENSEHCVHAHIDKNGLWNDIPCGNQLNVICEPIEIWDFFGSIANELSFMSKSILAKIKEYIS